MMYLPWRDHEELKFEVSYEKKLLMVSSQFVEKIEGMKDDFKTLWTFQIQKKIFPSMHGIH